MPNLLTKIPFRGTQEQQEKLYGLIEKYKNEQGALMPLLQEAQELYGYLPEEVQLIIAEGLGLSVSEVYGVVSFYTQFAVNPKGENTIAVCMGTACYVKGSGDVLARIEKALGIKAGEITPDGKFSIDATRCLGCCGLAPVMTINGEVYGRLTPDSVEKIIDKYR
jgi:NADH-quinone oxidoreductase E subunit